MHLGSFTVPAAVPAQATFGRDGAMFEGLLGFVAQLSLVLWSMVTLTVVIRFVGIRFYRRAARKALARITGAGPSAPTMTGPGAGLPGTAAPDTGTTIKPVPAIAIVPVITAGIDLLQPANVPLPAAVANVLASNAAER